MRTVQYRESARLRLAVLEEPGATAIDVADQLDPSGEAADLVTAIAQARREERPLDALLEDLARRADRRWAVDWDSLVLRDGGAPMPIDIPIAAPETWAAGVSYRRSRQAREYESGAANSAIYTRVYRAVRPELFLKDADSRRTVGPGAAVHVRPDSSWSVPEPEVALILDRDGRIVGYTIGNDVSARDIEAENPLYLPQAKVYSRSCALGPAALIATAGATPRFDIVMRITDRHGAMLFEGRTSSGEMKRSFDELVSFLTRYNAIDDGTVLLTGTGIVPPDDFHLTEDHQVEIEVSGIGVLRNMVEAADGTPVALRAGR